MDLSDIITESQLEQIIDEEIEAVLEKRKKKKSKRKKAGTESSKETSLHHWFKRKGAKGKKRGWVTAMHLMVKVVTNLVAGPQEKNVNDILRVARHPVPVKNEAK